MQVNNNSPYVQQAPATSNTSAPSTPTQASQNTPPAQQQDSIPNVPNWTVDLRANTMTTFPSDTMTRSMTFPDRRSNTENNDSAPILRPGDVERFSQPDDIGTNIRRAAGEFVDGLSPTQKVVGGIIAGAADFAVDGKFKIGGKIKF